MVGGLISYPLYCLKSNYLNDYLSGSPVLSTLTYLKNSIHNIDLNGLLEHSLKCGLAGSVTLFIHRLITTISKKSDFSQEDIYIYPTFRDKISYYFNRLKKIK